MANNVVITDELIPLMEEKLFANPKPMYVFSQFSNEIFDFTKQKGDTIRIMAPDYLAKTTNPDTARTLASLGSRVDALAVQAFTEQKQEIQLNEFIGPGTATAISPLVLQEYDTMHSIHDLVAVNGTILAEDYHRWRDDIYVKRLQDNTFRSYVNNRGGLGVLRSTDLFSTDAFLNVGAKLGSRFIPTFPDGNYIAVIGPNAKAQLLQEQKFLDATTRGGYAAGQAPIFTGELGVYGGIRYVVSNNIPTIAAGGSGVPFTAEQAFVFGTSLWGMFPLGSAEGNVSDIRTDFLRGFGAGPLVQTVGMPTEVRFREVTDYGRFSTVIWIEHAQYSVIDPNPGVGRTKGVDTRFAETLYGAVSVAV